MTTSNFKSFLLVFLVTIWFLGQHIPAKAQEPILPDNADLVIRFHPEIWQGSFEEWYRLSIAYGQALQGELPSVSFVSAAKEGSFFVWLSKHIPPMILMGAVTPTMAYWRMQYKYFLRTYGGSVKT
jgi:hypothetical protein